MPWFLPMLAAVAGATVATKIQNKRDKKAYRVAEVKNEERRGDYYVNLRKDAEKGGFNPLTALRSGGGMGYSNLAGRITQPLMTRSPLAAGISAASNAYTNYAMTRMNQQHDEKMTRLRSELYRADALAIHSATQAVDVYAQYPDKIPVKFGYKSFVIPTEIAKRMRINPNERVSIGELEEIFGEVGGNLSSAAAIEAQRKMFGVSYFGLLSGDPEQIQVTKQELQTPAQTWADGIRSIIDNASQPSMTRRNIGSNGLSLGGGYSNNPHYSGIFY